MIPIVRMNIITFNGEDIDLYPQVINEIILNWPGQIYARLTAGLPKL